MWIKGEYYDALGPVETVARGALDRDAQPCPFSRLDWFRLVADHAPHAAPLIVRARSDGTNAWLFLMRDGRGRLSALANGHSAAFGPIFAGPADELQQRRLLRAIANRLRRADANVTRIALPALGEDDARLLARAFRRSGWVTSARALPAGWRAHTQGQSFDDWWEARPASLRQRLDEIGRAAPHDLEVADRFTPALWAELEGLDRHADAFLRAWAERESAAGALRLAIARRRGEPVAAQLWTLAGGHATAHLLTQAPRHQDALPGAQLTATMFRYLLNVDQAMVVDLGPAAASWGAEWADERQGRVRLDLINPRAPLGWLPAAAASAAALVRRGPLD